MEEEPISPPGPRADDNEFAILSSPLAKRTLPSMKRQTDGLNRQDVVNAFTRAFLMTGGVPRLALWAHDNYGDFAKLYARLLPSATVNIGVQANQVVQHTLRPTALDSHPGQVIDLHTGLIIQEEPE